MGQTAPLAIFGETKEHAVGATPAPDPAAAMSAQAHAVKDALAPWHAGYDYYDFADIPAPASAVLPPAPPTAACRKSRPPATPARPSSPPAPSGRPGRGYTASGFPGHPHPSNNRPPPTRYGCRRPWPVNVRNSKPLGRTHEHRNPCSART